MQSMPVNRRATDGGRAPLISTPNLYTYPNVRIHAKERMRGFIGCLERRREAESVVAFVSSTLFCTGEPGVEELALRVSFAA